MGTLLSFGPGSAGSNIESYSIRLMFFLPTGRALKLQDTSECVLLGHSCHVKGEGNQYLLTASGFETEDAALSFLHKMWAGLMWYGIRNSTGIRFTPAITPVRMFDEPKSVVEHSMLSAPLKAKSWKAYDGDYDSDKTTIIPEHKRLIIFGLGSVTTRIDTPLENLAKVVLEGMEQRSPEATLANPKFRLATEVYLSSHFENTPGASFLSRISTLEILAVDMPSSDPIRDMVMRFIEDAKSAREAVRSEELRQELQSLISRLEYLQYRSIKSRIRNVVRELLENETDTKDATEAARLVSHLYDLRSSMVHTGEVDSDKIQDGNNKLNEIVPRLLRAMYRQLAK